MVTIIWPTLVFVVLTTLTVHAQAFPELAPVPALPPPPFDVWLNDVRVEAASRGIREEILDRTLTGIAPVAQILERDRTQTEFVLDVDTYLQRRVTRETVRTAQRMLSRHRSLLLKISKRYGVPSRVIVAVWGLESNFGRFAGVRPTIPTLATLAYDPRRSAFFREELFSALQILNRGDIELDRLKGSWAGALGQPQFMPSSYLQYAEDFDGDGRRDIWTSPSDIFASVANYLHKHGWKPAHTWGREVKVPAAARESIDALPTRETGCRARRLMSLPQPLSAWRRLGLRTLTSRALPTAEIEASIVPAGSRYFLVYSNYDAFLAYNCAHTYALAVALLSDRIE